jgi:hypothetical protein
MSSRRTYDTEIITVRQVNALNPNNSVIDAQRVLTTDGAGGTYWAVPSSLGAFGAYNEVVVNNLPFVSDLSYNRLYISTAQGMGCSANSTTKLMTLYSKGFDTINIEGGNPIYSYSNSVLSPTFTLAGGNGISVSSDPVSKKIFINGQTSAISTGIYGYSKFNVISNASTATISTIRNSNNSFLNATSPSTGLTFAGVGDILLSTNVEQNMLFMSISSFTSKGYNDLKSVAYGNYASCMSSVSTLFLDNYGVSSIVNAGLVSTTASLQYQISRNANNVQDNYTNLDLYKLLSSSVVSLSTVNSTNMIFNRGLLSTVSFASSINIGDYRGVRTGYIGTDGHLSVSTASFRLDSMSTLLNQNAQISLAYSPSLVFNFNVVADSIFYVSTLIIAGSETTNFPLTTFCRPWLVLAGAGATHVYTDTINLTFNASLVNNKSLTSSFTFLHHVDSFNTITYGGNSPVNADYLISPNNTLSLILTGTNYRSIN